MAFSLSGSLTIDIIAIFVALLTTIYFYTTRNFNFWRDKGVIFLKPLPLFGSIKDVNLGRISQGYFLKNVYELYKGEPYVGFYFFDEPALIIQDLELVKKVLVKDSHNFLDRMIDFDKELMPMQARGLFFEKGPRWKYLRTHLSPTFTSGKMKNMFYLVERCAKELEAVLEQATAEGSPVEVKECMATFTTDVIASCAFGIDSNAMKNPDAEFRVQLRKVFAMPKGFMLVKAVLFMLAPRVLKILRLNIAQPEVDDFIRSTVWNTVMYREENSVTRNDFLDLLMEMRRKNLADTDKDAIKLEDDDYVAQAILFLTAGFETSSTTMSFTLYELAIQPDIQTRLRTEICEVLEKHKQEVTYDGLQEMTYLDMVVNETLRKYPVLPFLDRKCLADYEIPAPSGEGTLKLPAGTGINIPVMGIHYDPEYYPEPEKYDPERFSEESRSNRPNYTHMPFGEGPRFCIGMRFGLMQVKTGVIHILSRYEVAPCKDTPIPLVLDLQQFFVASKGGIPLSFKKIQQ